MAERTIQPQPVVTAMIDDKDPNEQEQQPAPGTPAPDDDKQSDLDVPGGKGLIKEAPQQQ